MERVITSEADLEKAVLSEIGRIQRESEPFLTMSKNEVGVGYRGAVKQQLCRELSKFGDRVVQAAMAVLAKNHITYGLGVGTPDLVGGVRGRWCGLELKWEDGRLSENQNKRHAALRERGCFVTVVRTPEEVESALRRCAEGKVE